MKIQEPKAITIAITTAGQTVKVDRQLDDVIQEVVGYKITADIEVKAYHRGVVNKFELSGKKIIGEDTDAKNFMAGYDCPPDFRYTRFEEAFKMDSKTFLFEYTDKSHPTETFAPYTVTLLLKVHKS